VPLAVVRRDDDVEQVAQPDGGEGHRRRIPALRRDDAQTSARVPEHSERFGDAVVRPDELVMPTVVVLAVDVVELPRLLPGKALHLGHERLPHAGGDVLIGKILAEHGAYGMAERLHDELDGVHHRSIEVEQDRVEAAHRRPATCRPPRRRGPRR